MSGAQTSPFLTTNELLAPMAAYDTHANQLLFAQQRQQEVAANNTEVVARAASTLLDPTLYPTEEARAAGWGPIVQQLKANGYAPNAPADYPGLAHLQAAARMGTPSQTQQEWQANIAANRAYTAATTPPATAATPATSGAPATTGTPSGGATIGQRQNNPGNLTFAGQPGASPGQGNRFAAFPDMPTGVAANADQLALYQTQHGINTVRGAVTRWVGDPKADLTSYIGDVAKAIGVGPDDPVDLTNPDVQAKFIQAQFPHESAGGGYVLNPADVQKGVQMAAANRGRTVQAPGTVVATSGTPPGQPAAPAPYQVASTAPVPPPASTAPAAGQPQPQAQIPQPPANRVMPGSPDGPSAATPPPAPSTPAGGPAPPQLPPLNARGLTAPQQAQIDAVAGTGRMTVQQRMAAEQAFVNQNIQLAQKAFSDYVQLQQLAVSQGQLTNAQAETNLKYWQAAHPELAPNAREATIAFRTLQELAPAMRAPNPPQDVIDRYNNAAVAYQDFKTITDPISKATVQVPSRPLPDGFPPPSSARGGEGGVRTLIPGMSPAQQEVEKKLGENFADQDTKAYAGANNSLYALGQMNNASEILDKQGGSAWTATGPAANLRIATAQGVNTLGSLFGVAPTFDPAAIGSWEALNKQTKLMGFKIINAAFGASREAASVINNATSAVPSAENTYLGFRLVSSGIEQELQRERELYEFKADRVRGGQPLATAEADFNKTHPIDVYTNRAIANAVPDDIAGYLVQHPDTVKAFDGHFGPGIGEFVLKGGRTGLGQAARGR